MKPSFLITGGLTLLFFIAACNNNKSPDNNGNGDKTEKEKDNDNGNNNGNSSSTILIGKWRVTGYGYGMQRDQERMAVDFIEFMSRGKYVTSTTEDMDMGTYKYDEASKTLVTMPGDKGGVEESYTVELSGDNKMVLTYNKGSIRLERQ